MLLLKWEVFQRIPKQLFESCLNFIRRGEEKVLVTFKIVNKFLNFPRNIIKIKKIKSSLYSI